MTRVEHAGLKIDAGLAALVENELTPGTGVTPATFWAGLASLVADLAPKNRALLAQRDALQLKIDTYHQDLKKSGTAFDAEAYKAFLGEIGYLLPEVPDFHVDTTNVDPEVALVPGPQLVVPVSNARYALNAANARWGQFV